MHAVDTVHPPRSVAPVHAPEHPGRLDPTDQDLIARIVAADEAALLMLYERYRRLIYAIAARITGDWALAEEVLQDVFFAVWRTAHGYRRDNSVSSWISGIARHRAIDLTRSRSFRARTRERELDAVLPLTTPDETDLLVDRRHLREQIARALVSLSAGQREVIRLAYAEGLSHSEIAQHLGEPLGTIKTRLRTGLVKLRRALSSA